MVPKPVNNIYGITRGDHTDYPVDRKAVPGQDNNVYGLPLDSYVVSTARERLRQARDTLGHHRTPQNTLGQFVGA